MIYPSDFLMPLDKEIADAFLVLFELFQLPVVGADGRFHVDMHRTCPRVEAHAGIDRGRNVEIHRYDGRLQAGRQMKRPLVEVSDFAGRDSTAFRAEIDRLSSPTQNAIGALEDSSS